MYRSNTVMNYLYTAISVLCVVLWMQQDPGGNVLAKKPSRPVSATVGNRPRQQQQVVSKGKSKQQPISRKPPPSAIKDDDDDDDNDDVETFGGITDDDDDSDDEVVIQRQSASSSRSNQRKGPATARPVPRPMNGKTAPTRPTRSIEVDNDEDDMVYDDEIENDYDEDEDYTPSRRQQPQQHPQRGRPSSNQKPAFVGRRSNGPPPSTQSSRNGNRNNNRTQQRRPNSNGGNRRNPGGRVVPYSRPPPPGYGAAAALAQGWSGLVNSLPDPNIVKEAALSSINAAKQTTSSLSANIYREVKGLTSSELEQVMLKATRPDDTAVKGKHVERLVGVTYQVSSRYDIYDAVLRKLWSKMAEKDWRTTIKALYILHRFSADGSPEHAPSLKARLRELRRSRDPKRKDKFFNQKQLLAGDVTPMNVKFRAFMGRYANYVLLRTQSFSGMFEEISSVPAVKTDSKKKAIPPKPITSTSLRAENLKAAEMLLKAGIACQLKDGEICENTAIAAERVASDMIELTSSVAMALNRVLKESPLPKGIDVQLIKLWCIFYSEQLLPQTKAMVKKMSPNLDVFGLYLPSRMGTSVPPNLIEKGLNLVEEKSTDNSIEGSEDAGDSSDDIKKAAEIENEVMSKNTAASVAIETATEPEIGSASAKSINSTDDDEEYQEEEPLVDSDEDEEEDEEESNSGTQNDKADDEDEYEYEDVEDDEEDDYEDDYEE